MSVQHNLLSGANLHEPKGVATAGVDKVYKANGAGSGTWDYPIDGIDTAAAGEIATSDGAGTVTWARAPSSSHAEIYITSGATAHALAGGSAYTLLNPGTEWTSGEITNLAYTPASGSITLSLAGHYKVAFHVIFTTAVLAAGTAFDFKYALDAVVAPRKLSIEKHTGGTDNISVSGSGLVQATAGQLLTIQAAGDGTSSGSNITVLEAGFSVIHLG